VDSVTPSHPAALAWARLLRLPNLLTALADVGAGLALAGGPVPPGRAALLLAAGPCLYGGGIVLNDWCDRRLDAIERPGRPLVAGAIPPAAALTTAALLFVAGCLLAAAAGPLTGRIAIAIAVLAIAYDTVLKRWPVPATAAIAGCRLLDVGLGIGATPVGHADLLFPLPLALLVAAAMAVSRTEATGGDPRGARAALVWLAAAAAVVVAFALGPLRPYMLAALLPLALPLPALIAAVREPTPPRLQGAVGRILLAIIPLDAALALGSHRPWAAIAILALLPAARLLARRIPMT